MKFSPDLPLILNAVQSMEDGVIIVKSGLQTDVSFVNQSFERMIGLATDDILGKNLKVLKTDPSLQNAILKLVETVEKKQSFKGEVLSYTKNGAPLWFELFVNPVQKGNQELSFIGVIRDITAKKEAEQFLRDKNEEMNNFVYKASHDIRGPLASIIGLTNLGIDRVDSAEAKQYFELIRSSTARLDNILQDLLEISKISHASLEITEIDVEKTIEEIISSLRHSNENIQIDFTFEKLKHIRGDKKIFTSLIQNLLDNSVKYSDLSKKKPFIKVSVSQTDSETTFEIIDNGIGIPENLQSRVFDMFFRATDQSKGTGLGLFIVKASVEKIGGKISFISQENLGTNFKLIVPNFLK